MNVHDTFSLEKTKIQAITKALDVLRSLENLPDGLSLSQIAKATSLPRSTVQRISATLSDQGFLVPATASTKVRLGPALLQLASSLEFDIAEIVRPFLRELGHEVQETVDLSVQRGGSVVAVDQIIGRRRLVAVSQTGDRTPLHRTAAGKALLATLPSEAARRAIERSQREHGSHPPADPARLTQELDEIRRSAIAYDREDHSAGVSAIATALPDPLGGYFAVSVSMPTSRFRRSEAQTVAILTKWRRIILSKLA